MIRIILYLLSKIPYRTKWGLSLDEELKEYCYRNLNWREKCICGGEIVSYGVGYEGWVTECTRCNHMYDED